MLGLNHHQESGLHRTTITVRNLSKVYEAAGGTQVHALDDISFTMRNGEFVSVVGPSGCGKSTLLKVLAGLIPPTSGTALLGGDDATKLRGQVGVVFQSAVLLPWRTVRQNVMLPPEVLKLPKEECEARADYLLDLVGLAAFHHRYPFELSGGMQQRVAIVRALMTDPSLLLMDEPFGALDAMTREQMQLELLNIWATDRKTVMFITHSITEAVFLSDTVFVMTPRPGRLAQQLTIDLPRPRSLEMVNSTEFGKYVKQIRELLHERSVS